MEILYILNTLVLGFVLWDIHKDSKAIAQIVKDTAQIVNDTAQIVKDVAVISKEVSDKTDAILGRLR